jgi:hypothetical protein
MSKDMKVSQQYLKWILTSYLMVSHSDARSRRTPDIRCPQSGAANSQFLEFQAAAADLSSVTIGHFDVCCLVLPLVAYVG